MSSSRSCRRFLAIDLHTWWAVLIVTSCLVTYVTATSPTSEDEHADSEGDKKGTRPRGVTAEVLNATTISLTWKPPKIASETCDVKRYVLRLKQDGARRSRAWKVDGARKALGLHNLKPDTLYSIRLVAITCDGKGKPTKWLDIMTTTTSKRQAARKEGGGNKEARLPREEPSGFENRHPGRPTNVRTRTFPDSVILTWQEPAETEIVVRGYMVGYGEGVPDVNWQYVDSNQRNITIKSLKPSTQYIISLRAFNNQGKGPTVYDMIYTRELAGPTMDPTMIQTPQNLRAKVLSSNNVWLQWRDPSLDKAQQITDERYYNVHYKALPDGEKLSVVVKALHVVLYELTPGTVYEFTVRTVKDSFYSEFSDPIRNTTFETAPTSSPRSVRVLPGNGSNVLIQWRPPKEPNGEIKGYLVLYSNDRVKPIAEWNAAALSDTSTKIRGLHPGETYYFKVQARNSVGYGPLSKTSAFTMPTGLPVDPDEPTELVNSVYADFDTSKVEEMTTRPSNAFVVDTVTNSTELEATETNSTGPQTGALSQAQKAKAAANEVHFAAKVLHTISAFITWPSTPPNCNCETGTIQYIFHLYMRGKEETPQMSQLESNVVHLEDLDPNERYHYQVKYILPNGTETAWSQEQELDTDCGRGLG